MSKIWLLNFLTATENILCIHRNYYSFKKYVKVLVLARVILAIFLNLAICVAYILPIIYSTDDLFHAAKYILYIVLSTNISIAPIIFGISRAFAFKIVMENYDSVYEYFNGDVIYDKKLNTLRKVVLCVCACCALFAIYCLCHFLATHQLFFEDQYASNVSFVIRGFWVVWKNFRYHFEILTINVLIRIIIISLAQLKTKLVSLSETLDDSIDGIDDLIYYQFQMELKQWFSAYNKLALCSDGINKCFGIQIVSSLCLLQFCFISLSYNMLASLISKEARISEIEVILLINCTIAIIVLLYNSQYAKNEGEVIKRSMIKIYGKILTLQGRNVSELKRLVRDYRRQMALQPINIRIMSTTNLQMSLLLAILSTGASYVIVLLQFRHIV